MDKILKYIDSSPLLIYYLFNTIIAAFIIFVGGIFVARHIRKRLKQSKFGGRHVDETLRPIIASFIFYVLIGITLYAVLIKLGVPPTSLFTIFGAAGLAVALALKDTLSNIAAGIMLLFLRPLSVGETIDMNGVIGTVEEIDLFSTTLKAPDGLFLYIPNGIIWNNRVQNFSRHATRRATINLRIGFENDLEAVQEILLATLNKTPDILHEPAEPRVFVTSFEDMAIHISCQCWLPKDNWPQRVNQLHVNIKKTLDAEKINMAIPNFPWPKSTA